MALAQGGQPPRHALDLDGLPGNDVLRQLPSRRVAAMLQYQAGHLDRAGVVRNHHRQKVDVGVAAVAWCMHVLHHAGHSCVHVALEARECGWGARCRHGCVVVVVRHRCVRRHPGVRDHGHAKGARDQQARRKRHQRGTRQGDAQVHRLHAVCPFAPTRT